MECRGVHAPDCLWGKPGRVNRRRPGLLRRSNCEGRKIAAHLAVEHFAFTLLEMLVVMAIIAILAGLIIPTYFRFIRNARITTVTCEVKQLESAFKHYLDYYRMWPSMVVNDNEMEISGDLFKIMRGQDMGGDNRDEIQFFQFQEGRNAADPDAAYDIWGDQPYRVKFDDDYNGEITGVAGGSVYRTVAVWSCGTNYVSDIAVSGPVDDIRSWE